jgi:putative ABC transport system permease protein
MRTLVTWVWRVRANLFKALGIVLFWWVFWRPSDLRIAWRNVWRNKRRSMVTIAAMAFALFFELLYAGLIPGMLGGMQEDITSMEVGDIQIHAAEYLERPSMYTTIEQPDALLAKIDEAGWAGSARVLGGGLMAAAEYSAGVAFRGVDVERDGKVTQVSEGLDAGEWLDPADPKGVVLGKVLARVLNVKVGEELVVLTQAADGSMGNDLYHVRGVLMSISGGTDRSTVYVNETTLRDLLVMPEGAHQIIVALPDEADLTASKEALVGWAEPIGGATLEILTWRELLPIVGQMLDSVEGMIWIIFFIIYIAVGILILNAMLMAVFERIRELGVLKALGLGPSKVYGLVLTESGIQIGIAAVVGVLLALGPMWYLQTHGINVGSLGGTDMMGVAMRPIWNGIYNAEVATPPLILLFFVAGGAAIYPALKAAWLNPVKAMTHR